MRRLVADPCLPAMVVIEPSSQGGQLPCPNPNPSTMSDSSSIPNRTSSTSFGLVLRPQPGGCAGDRGSLSVCGHERRVHPGMSACRRRGIRHGLQHAGCEQSAPLRQRSGRRHPRAAASSPAVAVQACRSAAVHCPGWSSLGRRTGHRALLRGPHRPPQVLLETIKGLRSGSLTLAPTFLLDHMPKAYAIWMWNDYEAHG